MKSIYHLTSMSDQEYAGLSEENKLKMIGNRFLIDASDWDTVYPWVYKNLHAPFHVRSQKADSRESVWISFYSDEDAAAFKLRWVNDN